MLWCDSFQHLRICIQLNELTCMTNVHCTISTLISVIVCNWINLTFLYQVMAASLFFKFDSSKNISGVTIMWSYRYYELRWLSLSVGKIMKYTKQTWILLKYMWGFGSSGEFCGGSWVQKSFVGVRGFRRVLWGFEGSGEFCGGLEVQESFVGVQGFRRVLWGFEGSGEFCGIWGFRRVLWGFGGSGEFLGVRGFRRVLWGSEIQESFVKNLVCEVRPRKCLKLLPCISWGVYPSASLRTHDWYSIKWFNPITSGIWQ